MAVVVAFAFAALSDGLSSDSSGVNVVGVNEVLDIRVSASASSRQDVVSYPSATYISVHFLGFNLPEGDVVVVRSPDSSVKHTYLGKGRSNLSNFVASFIPGDTAIVEYIASTTHHDDDDSDDDDDDSDEASGLAYTISGFSRGIVSPKYESVCGGSDQSVPAKCYLNGAAPYDTLPLAYEKSKSVARILVNGTMRCTGWLIGSEQHFITNFHCIPSAALAAVTDFEFGAESSSCSEECMVDLGCEGPVIPTTSQLIARSAIHDFTLVKISSSMDLSPYKYLQLRGEGAVQNETIYVPQHPNGFAKRIVSVMENNVSAFIKGVGETSLCGSNEISYAADTQGGSSGSPVIATSDNAVVGLHHCGFASVCANFAVDARDIISELRKQNITVKDMLGEFCLPYHPLLYACAPIPPKCLAPQPGVDFVGDDIVSVRNLNNGECCDLCAETPGCIAYTHRHYTPEKNSMCYLKSGTGAKTKSAGAVSAVVSRPNTCATMPWGSCSNSINQSISCCPTGFFCEPSAPANPGPYLCLPRPSRCLRQFTDVEIYGSDFKTLHGISSANCCESCADSPGCAAYSFVPNGKGPGGVGSCYLKTSVVGRRAASGVLSAMVN